MSLSATAQTTKCDKALKACDEVIKMQDNFILDLTSRHTQILDEYSVSQHELARVSDELYVQRQSKITYGAFGFAAGVLVVMFGQK